MRRESVRRVKVEPSNTAGRNPTPKRQRFSAATPSHKSSLTDAAPDVIVISDDDNNTCDNALHPAASHNVEVSGPRISAVCDGRGKTATPEEEENAAPWKQEVDDDNGMAGGCRHTPDGNSPAIPANFISPPSPSLPLLPHPIIISPPLPPEPHPITTTTTTLSTTGDTTNGGTSPTCTIPSQIPNDTEAPSLFVPDFHGTVPSEVSMEKSDTVSINDILAIDRWPILDQILVTQRGLESCPSPIAIPVIPQIPNTNQSEPASLSPLTSLLSPSPLLHSAPPTPETTVPEVSTTTTTTSTSVTTEPQSTIIAVNSSVTDRGTPPRVVHQRRWLRKKRDEAPKKVRNHEIRPMQSVVVLVKSSPGPIPKTPTTPTKKLAATAQINSPKSPQKPTNMSEAANSQNNKSPAPDPAPQPQHIRCEQLQNGRMSTPARRSFLQQSPYLPTCCLNCQAPWGVSRHPILLVPCGHNVCSICMSSADASVKETRICPMCGNTVFHEKENGLLMELLKVLYIAECTVLPQLPAPIEVDCGEPQGEINGNEARSTVLCEECTENKAVVWCEKDSIALCSACDVKGHSLKISQTHRRVPIEERLSLSPQKRYRREPKCPQHPEKDLDIWCADDQTLCCLTCKEFGDHQNHKCLFRDDVCKQHLKQMSNTEEESASLKSTLEFLQNSTKTLNTEKAGLCIQSIQKIFSALHETLKKRELELISMVGATENDLRTALLQQIGETLATITLNEAAVEASRYGNTFSLLEALSLKKKFIPIESPAMCGSLSFDCDLATMTKSISEFGIVSQVLSVPAKPVCIPSTTSIQIETSIPTESTALLKWKLVDRNSTAEQLYTATPIFEVQLAKLLPSESEADSAFRLVYSGKAPSYECTALQPDTKYSSRIRALIAPANSDSSSSASASASSALNYSSTTEWAEATFTTLPKVMFSKPGRFTFTVPEGVTRISAIVIGGGAAGGSWCNGSPCGGGDGGPSEVAGVVEAGGGEGGKRRAGLGGEGTEADGGRGGEMAAGGSGTMWPRSGGGGAAGGEGRRDQREECGDAANLPREEERRKTRWPRTGEWMEGGPGGTTGEAAGGH